jgi:hypothetical protein
LGKDLDPDLNQHQNGKSNPDRYQNDANPQNSNIYGIYIIVEGNKEPLVLADFSPPRKRET